MAKISKSSLIDMVAKEVEMTKVQIEKVYHSIFDNITQSLVKGDAVALPDFGIFSTKIRKARTGRNPKTGATLNIPESKVAGFKVGKKLKDSVSEN